MRPLNGAEFGVVTLYGRESRHRTCVNGLPATQSSTRMLGRFPVLASLCHPGLCAYMELIRSSTLDNAVFLVSEHYASSVADEISKLSLQRIVEVSKTVLSSFIYLHSKNLVLGYFTLNSVLILPEGGVRIALYGLNYLTGGGMDVNCCLGSPWYLSPERLMRTRDKGGIATRASDMWAFGIVLLEMALGIRLSDIWGLRQISAVVTACVKKAANGSALPALLEAIRVARPDLDRCVDPCLSPLLQKLLLIYPSQRPSSEDLFKEFQNLDVISYGAYNEDHPFVLPPSDSLAASVDDFRAKINSEKNVGIESRPLNEAFFLWKLSGGSVETILLNQGVIKANSPINTLPLMIAGDCCMYGNSSARRYISNFDVFILPSNNLRKRMTSVRREQFVVNFELSVEKRCVVELSLFVKEKDIEYQARRMLLLSRLIKAFPFKKSALFTECAVDVPPLHRAALWAACLNISDHSIKRFHQFDTLSEHSSDRQLMVDIPRCHQYDELMASPAAHCRLKRLLKAWLLAHPSFVYWQGLDSLSAPFLVLHFNQLPVAFACLESFITLYLNNFFLKDNSAIIQEYLAVFNHLLAFVDAVLYAHLAEMDFLPELFAIPWFLTCFAHVLPLHKLFHVWDVLLLADSSFPLFIGLAIMIQLRPRLISAHFNDAILLFSDLPDLNIERIVQDSQALYRMVPTSCTYRRHSSHHLRETHSLSHLGVNELKDLCCPRISATDVSRLIDNSSVLIIDVRAQNEYLRGAVVGSVNFPPCGSEEPLDLIRTALRNAQSADHVVVIVDNQHVHRANKVALRCVLEGFNRICILDCGIESLRSMPHLFFVPS